MKIAGLFLFHKIGAWLSIKLKINKTSLASTKPWVCSLVPNKLGIVAHTRNPNTQEVEAGTSQVQGHPWPNSEFKANLSYMRHYLKIAQKQTSARNQKACLGMGILPFSTLNTI